MSTADYGSSKQQNAKKRRRSNKPEDGPVKQRRKVDDTAQNTMKANGLTNGQHTITVPSSTTNEVAIAQQDVVSSELEPTTAKARRRRRHKAKKSNSLAGTAVTAADLTSSPSIPSNTSKTPAGSWHFGPIKGGRLLNQDPIFSSDGKFVITATRRGLRINSIQDSLLERTIRHSENLDVASYALSVVEPKHIYVTYHDDKGVHIWDWTTGAHVAQVHTILENTIAMAVAAHPDGINDTLWSVQRIKTGWQLVVDGRGHVYNQDNSSSVIKNLTADKEMAVATCGASIIIAQAHYDAWRQDHDNEDPPRTTCNEYTTAAETTSLAVRTTNAVTGPKKAKRSTITLSIAAGTINGEIYLYENVPLSTDAALSAPRTLHWHRESVGAIKWSKDGNYLISGGRETVLVLWQLTTGKKQFLPHLAAEIEAVTVSPDGTAYAIMLADNSVMVLSTSELVPIANFPGFQAVMSTPYADSPTKPAVTSTFQSTHAIAAIHPLRSSEILLAVPPSTPSSDTLTQIKPKPFLQTFDLDTDRHTSRQALSRNKLTDFTTGPEGNVIQEPDTTHMRISHDGQWLVTIEQWTPPSRDVEYLAADDIGNSQIRKSRAEIYLKFWQWSVDKEVWTLDTRIQNPHPMNIDDEPGRVLDVVSDPAEIGFATLGEDGCVRVWKPQTRRRDGLIVSANLADWKARHVAAIEQEWDADEAQSLFGALAYSPDGSLLAIHLAPRALINPSPIRFFNTSAGKFLEPRSGLYTGKLASLGFVGRHLILLSSTAISIWDIVAATLTHRTKLEDPKGLNRNQASNRLLATSQDGKCFAVTIPADSLHTSTRVLVYQAAPFQKLCDKIVADVVTAILNVPGAERRFHLLLASAEIITLEQSPEAVSLPDHATNITRNATNGLHASIEKTSPVQISLSASEDATMMSDTSEEPQDANVDSDASDAENEYSDTADDKVVSAERLDDIFAGVNGQGTLNMPVSAMFEAVVGLFAKKSTMRD